MNKMNELIENITIEDMPTDDFKCLASLFGIKTALKILEIFSGCNIYVPTKGYRFLIYKYIRQNYDGTAKCVKKFARKFGLSEQAVYNILNKKKPIKQLIEGEVNL